MKIKFTSIAIILSIISFIGCKDTMEYDIADHIKKITSKIDDNRLIAAD